MKKLTILTLTALLTGAPAVLADSGNQTRPGDSDSRRARRMQQLDTNGDGSVSTQERQAFKQAKQAKKAERRSARQATKQTRTQARKAKKAERRARRELARTERGEKKGAKKATKQRGKKQARVAKRFKKLDHNSDGAVSKREFTSHAAKRFKKLDTNSDGKLSKAELKRSRKGATSGKRNKGHKQGKNKTRRG